MALRQRARFMTVPLSAFVFIILHSLPVAAQPARLTGRVWDAATGLPMPSAQVSVPTLGLGMLTTADGRYSFTLNVGIQTVQVQAAFINYTPVTAQVTTNPGGTTRRDFTLSAGAPAQPPLGPIRTPSSADTAQTADLNFSIPDSALVRHRQVVFDRSVPIFTTPTTTQLFDDVIVTLRPREVERLGPDQFNWRGDVLNSQGVVRGEATLILRAERITGDIRFGRRMFQILPYSANIHVILEVDLGLLPFERDQAQFGINIPPRPPFPPPGFERPFIPEFPWFRYQFNWLRPFEPVWLASSTSSVGCSDLANLTNGSIADIRLMVLYTAEAEAALGTLSDDIALMIDQTNQAFEHSGVRAHLTLAFAGAIPTVDDGTIGESIYLARLIDPADGQMDAAQGWRDAAHADVTILLLENAYGGWSHQLEVVGPLAPDSAYGVVKHGLASSSLQFPHELGHLMGLQHEQPTGGGAPRKPYRYNHGYGPDTYSWTTIMALTGSDQDRLPWFSNPNVFLDGVAMGISSANADAADNARALNNITDFIAGFRITPVWFTSLSGITPWGERHVSEVPMSFVRFGDFDNDGEDDAFRIDAETHDWLWSRSGAEDWAVLNGGITDIGSISDVAFGDFDGDGHTDVFKTDVATGTWYWSPAGTGAWQVLKAGGDQYEEPLWRLAFADFDGDDHTDVFRSDVETGTWYVAKKGTENWQLWNGPDPALSVEATQLRFGDFDNDGGDDALVSYGTPSHWYLSKRGSGVLELWNEVSDQLDSVHIGRFSGDGRADAFKADGSNWLVSEGASEPWAVLRPSCHTLPSLNFGDVDGDGRTDVMRAGLRP
jgi:hypothetical protein